MAKRFKVEAVFKGVDNITAPISRMENRIGKFLRKASAGFIKFNRTVQKLASSIKSVALGAVASLATIGFAIKNIVSVGAEFGRAIGTAAAKFPEDIQRGTKAFKALSDSAREVGRNTEFSATQAAQGLNFLAKAGFNAELSMKSLGSIVDFATASEIDLGIASDIASDALGAFGLNTGTSEDKMNGLVRVMDVMSLTANRTNTSVEELFESVKDGAPIAVKAGQSIETFSALAGTLAGSGIKGGRAGTALKNITLALAGEGNQAAKTFKALGVKLSEGGKFRDVADVFDDLSVAVSKVDPDQVLGIVNAIFGKISIASAANLLGDGAKNIRKLRAELIKANGSTKRIAKAIRNDVKGSLDSLTSSIEDVKIGIFDLNEGPLKDAIDGMTKWVRENNKLISSKIGEFLLDIINNLGDIVKWITRVGVALTVFFTFATILGVITNLIVVLNFVMALNPMFLMVVGVLALVAAFTSLIVWIDDINESMEKMPFAIRLIMSPLEALIKAIKLFKDAGAGVGGAIGESLFGLFNDEFDINAKTTGTTNAASAANVVTPAERIARSIDEKKTTTEHEVTIKAEKGTAVVTGGNLNNGLKLQATGAP